MPYPKEWLVVERTVIRLNSWETIGIRWLPRAIFTTASPGSPMTSIHRLFTRFDMNIRLYAALCHIKCNPQVVCPDFGSY